MVLRNPIIIQYWDEEKSAWMEYFTCHARINTSKSVSSFESGVANGKKLTDFDIRYCKQIAKIEHETQLYRILYNKAIYDILEYDDYMEQHRIVRLKGVGRYINS